MRHVTIKKYLRTNRIGGRWTTFNGALQAALGVPDPFDEVKVGEAMSLLGQPPDEELSCVYCGAPAATWDHLHNNVIKGRFSGYGHRIFNLVPACRTCNERKGAKHWRVFIDAQRPPDHEARVAALTRFEANSNEERFGWDQILVAFPELAAEYDQIRSELRTALGRADEIAAHLRERIRARAAEKAESRSR